ncbi:MAG: hypothetical protein D6781_08905 [Verrucomicrobia bacterium]|nr:MAG: hypothetical protein D6781_08905 [Verrucomicrobiota bacterium]
MSQVEKVRFWQPLRAVQLVHHGDPAPTLEQMRAAEKAAYERGTAEASASVNQQILDQRRELAEACETLFKSLETSVSAAVAEVHAALPELALQIARRVLSRVEISREVVAGVVEELLAEIGPDVGPVEVRLHPADLEFIRDLEPQLARNHPDLRLVADEALGRGDCQAMTRFGKIDGRIESKLEQIEATLTTN